MHTNTVIIGAGHAGLAMSRCLADRGVEHVVLERGRLGERWRSARWDSFRLITPAWMLRLPGHQYIGPDPDGYLTAAELVQYLDAYARGFGAPVREMTTVTDVQRTGHGYAVRTDRGDWRCANVVVATGYHSRPRIPCLAGGLPPDLLQINPASYRHPEALPAGDVLVVGASASGVQIADELVLSGRGVVLAVGRHTALPRRYAGRDIMWWLDRIGSLDRTIDEVPDPDAARRDPSLQLSGSGHAVDLAALQRRGVDLAGRLVGADDARLRFADDLPETVVAAQARLRRVLDEIDQHRRRPTGTGSATQSLRAMETSEALWAREAMAAITLTPAPRRLDLDLSDIATVVWATGFRPAYPWLRVPVLDHTGRIQHRRGVTSSPGLYAIGLRFQHRRNATFIDGARHDANYLADHITARAATAAPCPSDQGARA